MQGALSVKQPPRHRAVVQAYLAPAILPVGSFPTAWARDALTSSPTLSRRRLGGHRLGGLGDRHDQAVAPFPVNNPEAAFTLLVIGIPDPTRNASAIVELREIPIALVGFHLFLLSESGGRGRRGLRWPLSPGPREDIPTPTPRSEER